MFQQFMFQQFRLDEVHLEDEEFKNRRELVKEYLLQFDVRRLMYTFRKNAGIPTEAEPLGGWEAPECGLRGHFVGHFLSACAKYAFSDQEEGLRRKAEDIVQIMGKCMRWSDGQPDVQTAGEKGAGRQTWRMGYLSAFPETVLDELEKEENRNVWAPYYTLHKIMQGLIDCARYLNNRSALELAAGLALYIRERFLRLSYWKTDGILRCTGLNPANEFGGMGEALYQLYELTEDERILETAKLFDRDYWIENLYRNRDILEDLHANTHLPMILAAMHRYELTGEQKYRTAAEHFYEYLLGRTFANGNSSAKASHFIPGGVSETAEHWGKYRMLQDALTGGESESCCAHNTEKIVKKFFLWTGDVKYLDHLERLKYNAVLNCASRTTGLSQYHQPMGRKIKKKFSGKYDSFWCCTGSGIEAMSELQKNIWFYDENCLLVNLFISSSVMWKEKKIVVQQKTVYPDSGRAEYLLHMKQPVRFRLMWKAGRVRDIFLNGKELSLKEEGGYVFVEEEFQNQDRVEVILESEFHTEALQGDADKTALLYDQILLAAAGDGRDVFTVGKTHRTIPGHWPPLYRIEEEEYSVYVSAKPDEENVRNRSIAVKDQKEKEIP